MELHWYAKYVREKKIERNWLGKIEKYFLMTQIIAVNFFMMEKSRSPGDSWRSSRESKKRI
jgi:hypothetical protein